MPQSRISSIPHTTRLLLALTTSRLGFGWGGGTPLGPLAEEFVREGWTLRMAHWRNYLLWRNGNTLTLSKAMLLVLPAESFGLETRLFKALVLGDLVRGMARLDDRDPDGWPGLKETVVLCFGGPPAVAVQRFSAALSEAERSLLIGHRGFQE